MAQVFPSPQDIAAAQATNSVITVGDIQNPPNPNIPTPDLMIETSRRYMMYNNNQHIIDYRNHISSSNLQNGMDSYLGRSHSYTRNLFSSTGLSDFSDNKQIQTYQLFLHETGSLDSSTSNFNPDYPDNVNFDYNHVNALDDGWDKNQLHLPINNANLLDNPYKGHPNLQVQPSGSTNPSDIFNPSQRWVDSYVSGVLPQIDPQRDGAYGTYDITRNEIKESRESIGKYFSKVYHNNGMKDPRNLGSSNIPDVTNP